MPKNPVPDIFVYGTLREPEVLNLIAGDGPFDRIAATLPDHCVLRQAHDNLPYLKSAQGRTCDGLLLRGLSARQVARLHAYEAPFDYTAHDVTVLVAGQQVAALAYFPDAAVQASEIDWSFDDWAQTLGRLARSTAQEIGSFDPPLSAAALKSQWGMIETRAAGRLRAADDPAPATLRKNAGPDDLTVLGHGPLWGDFFRAGSIQLTHTTFQGTRSEVLYRECFQGTDAAIVLPYDPKSDMVLLVEQIRMGPIVRGAANPWSLEPIAGMVDGRETPEDAALREAEEEAGLRGVVLEKMFSFYASPGNTTDFFNCYAGLCDLPEPRTYTGGLDTENEDLRLHIVPFDTAFALIETGEANNGPLIAMLLWLDRKRARLRSTA